MIGINMNRKNFPEPLVIFGEHRNSLCSVPNSIVTLHNFMREGEYQPYLPTNILRVAVKSPAVSVQK